MSSEDQVAQNLSIASNAFTAAGLLATIGTGFVEVTGAGHQITQQISRNPGGNWGGS